MTDRKRPDVRQPRRLDDGQCVGGEPIPIAVPVGWGARISVGALVEGEAAEPGIGQLP